MRKVTLGFVLALLVLTSAMCVCAEDLEYGNLKYRINENNEITIVGCVDKESVTNIEIPAEIDGISVTEIGEDAFGGCKVLESVSLTEGLRNIGDGAFFECDGLTRIDIPYGVEYIGEAAFAGCEAITSIRLPDSLRVIGDAAFFGCEKLADINIPNEITKINDITFAGCGSLTELRLPNSVESIGSGAFHGCDSLVKINIPDKVKVIEDGVFGSCSSLSEIIIPEGVTDIRTRAFSYCKSLSKIDIPESVTNIERWAFQACKGLTEIVLPEKLTSLDIGVFRNCVNLKCVKIPVSITAIEEGMFSECKSLTDVYYGGTEDEWNRVRIEEKDNDSLLKAKVHYNSSEISKPEFLDTLKVIKNGGEYEFSVDVSDIPYSCRLIAALYCGGGMTGIKSVNVASGSEHISFTAAADNADSARVFLWSGFNGIKPLCESRALTLEH